jgi:protein O-GlcNAc transferase
MERSAQTFFEQGCEAFALGRYASALYAFARSLKVKPDWDEAWANLGFTLYKLNEYRKAIVCLERVLSRRGEVGVVLHGLACAHHDLGDLEAALDYENRAVNADPNNEELWRNRATILAANGAGQLEVKLAFEDWGKRFADPLTLAAAPHKFRSVLPEQKIRIGYVSGDLKNHSVAFFMRPIFEHHDRAKFHISVFATLNEDSISEEIKQHVDTWTNVQSLNDEQLAELVRSSGIDVLVDLSGHTVGHRLLMFARKPAPVQVTWLGKMTTPGMKAFDYRLTDFGVDPPGAEQFYTEKLFRVPCMVPYVPPGGSAEPSVVTPGNANIMVSLNHLRKVGDACLLAWREILDRHPSSELLVVSNEKDPSAASSLLEERLSRLGVEGSRINTVTRMALHDFMHISERAAFALDSFPISGGTTTLHSLWMGLPVLALESQGIQNPSAATLRGVGLKSLVADALEDYVDKALMLLSDFSYLNQLRLTTRDCLRRSKLMDYKRVTQDIERAYEEMLSHHARQEMQHSLEAVT